MAYTKTNWLQRIAQYASRFTLTATGVPDEYDLAKVEGTITQAGTPISPTNLNKIEQGIYDAHIQLDASTNVATAATLIKRDVNGRAKVAAPSASDDIARKEEVDLKANKAGDEFTGQIKFSAPLLYDSSSLKDHRNLVLFSDNNASVTGAIVVELPFTPNNMSIVEITLYNYIAKSPYKFWVSFYTFSSGASLNYPSYIALGELDYRIRIAKNTSNNHIAIILGETTTLWHYPKLVVDRFFQAHGYRDDAHGTGWQVTITTDISGYTSLGDCVNSMPSTNIYNFANGSYSGNGTNNRNITVGFQPRYVFVWSNSGDTTAANRSLRITSEGGTRAVAGDGFGTLYLADTPSTSNASLTSTGFTVNAAYGNASGVTYRWEAWL